MQTFQASVAKTYFLKILDGVEAGESFQITRHGRKIARIVPEDAGLEYAERARRAFATMHAIRKHTRPTTVAEIVADKNSGRM